MKEQGASSRFVFVSRAKTPALVALLLLLTAAAEDAYARRAGQAPGPQVGRPGAGAQEGEPGAQEYEFALRSGYLLIGERRFAEAASLFAALVRQRPNERAALYGAALATFNAGRPADAEPYARRAAEVALAAGAPRKSDAADALVLLAVVLAVRGDGEGALKASGQAVSLAPESFDARLAHGRALYGAGDDARAVKEFRAAAALRPEDARPLFFLATALERAGEAGGALAAYRELAARHPRAAEGHLGLGALLVKRGGAEAEDGVRSLARAVELDPDNYEARVTLGRALVSRGRAAEAVEHLKRAAALAPGNPEPRYQLSLAYRRLGRREEAAAESEAVRRIHESRRVAPAPPQPER